MTLIERVGAVIEAGTPGPWGIDGSGSDSWGLRTLAGDQPVVAEMRHRRTASSEQDARKLALAVNLAPPFVALWEAAAAWEDEHHGNGNEYEVAAALEEALAALNEAATREVGESEPIGDGITDDTDAVRAATFLDAGWPIFGTPQKHVRSGHREVGA